MFGSCLNRNDYLHKPKMFDNADSWLDRLKRITDYEINKWNSYEETKQDKISVDTSKLTFNNNVLSVKDSFFNSIVETRLANFSSSFFNGAVAELQADIAQEILRLEGRLINDDSFNEYIDSKFIGYEKGNVLRQYITQYVTGYTYSTQEINNQLSYKQGQLSWGKGVKVNNDMEVSVNIDNEFSITRYLDIDRFVHINPAGDSDLVDGWDYAKEIDWQQLYHENKETQAFTVKNLLRIDYDEDTKVYTLGVPYTNRLVDADYAITSRTILRELRSEYEKKLFCLGNSIQLVNVDWFIHKFKETYEGYSTLTDDEVRTAYFGRNPEYPQLKTDFDAWYEIEYGPTAVDRITDLMCDCYQRAIIVNSSGTLDKYADGSALGENYWRTTLADQTHLKYLYTTDGTAYFTPDEYSTSSTFEVKHKIVELHNRIDSLDVAEAGGTNKYISAISETDGKISATVGNIDTTVTTNSDNLITSGAVWTAIDNLPEPMIFKGSIGSSGTIEWASLPSPSSSNKGFTYKVITDHNTAPICKVGDTIISDSTTWVVIPSGDEPSGTVTNVAIQGETNYIEVSGSPITSSGTISISLNTAQKVAWNNKISGVKVNGTDLTADANKKVNVIVPQVYRYV